jgi:hypothetical protein
MILSIEEQFNLNYKFVLSIFFIHIKLNSSQMSSTWVNQYFVKFKERCRGGVHQSYRKKLSYGTPWGVPPPLSW